MSQRPEPLVSAVIPTYKRPHYLLRAVRSALQQTLHNLCRSTPFFGEGVLPATSLFASTELLRRRPVVGDWALVDDLDWILRAIRIPGAGLDFVPTDEPLAIWNRDPARHPAITSGRWQRALHWAQHSRELVAPKAYAGFLLAYCTGPAARHGERKAFWPLVREAFAHGRPRPIDVATCLAYWCVPCQAQARLVALAAGISKRRALVQDEVV